MDRELAGRRVRALLLDWLIWAYVPVAILYYFRDDLPEGVPTVWLYLGAVGLGLVLALILGSLGTTIGKRVANGAEQAADGAERAVDGAGGVAAKGPPWYRTQVGWTAVILAVITLVLGWQITEINLYYVFTRADRMRNITERLLRPNWPIVGTLVDRMVETIFLALMSTLFAIPLAAIVSFFAARNLMHRVTAPWGRVLATVVLGALGAVLGVVLVSPLLTPFGNTNLDVRLVGGILSPLLALVGLAVFTYLGNRLVSGIASAPRPAQRAVNALLTGLLGAGAAYLLASAVAMIVYAASWAIFVRELSPWPYVVLGVGAVAGVAVSFFRRLDQEFPVGAVVYDVVRFVLNTTRSIEPFVWALVFVTWFRLGPFPGMVALMVHSVAALGKLYSEQIEGIDPGPLEAVRATGANELQTIVYAVVPQIIPPFISFTIYRWDINVRLSTIIGLVGGGGIGQLLFQYQNLGQWRSVSVAVILIVAVVMTLDQVSARIRERII